MESTSAMLIKPATVEVINGMNTIKMKIEPIEPTASESEQMTPKSDEQGNQEGENIQSANNLPEDDNGNSSPHISNNNNQRKKIFVGGLPPDITEEEFREFFEKFGKIIDIFIIRNIETHKSRGFGFVIYESEQTVEFVLSKNFYHLKSKRMEVKQAKPKEIRKSGVMQPNINIDGVSDVPVSHFYYGDGYYYYVLSTSSFNYNYTTGAFPFSGYNYYYY